MRILFLIAIGFSLLVFAATECQIKISNGCLEKRFAPGKFEISKQNDAHQTVKKCFQLARQISTECTEQKTDEPMISAKFFRDNEKLAQRRFEVDVSDDLEPKVGKENLWIRKVSDQTIPVGEVQLNVAKDGDGPKISKKVFGSNILYFYKNTNLLDENHPFEGFIQDAEIKMIRFPGGTVANNYDWKTNRLDNPNVFPGEEQNDPAQRPNFKKFLKFRDRVNGVANFVVNISGPYHTDLRGQNGRAPSKQEYIRRAVEWVCAVNGGPVCERKGFQKLYPGSRKVHYWEIGNEHYHDHDRYKMTAEDYAKDLVLYSKAMKEVDPSIRIGAVGPFGANSVGAKDISLRRNVLWWPKLGEIAGAHIDFLVTHRYDPTRYRNWEQPLEIASTMAAIRKAYLEKTNKNFIHVAMTEYNLSDYESQLSLSKVSIAQVEQLIELMQGQVFFANFWPTVGFRPIDRSQLVISNNVLQPNGSYASFKAIAQSLRRYIVPLELRSSGNTNLLDAFVSRTKSKKNFSLVFLNRDTKELKVNLNDFLGAGVGEALQFYSFQDGLREAKLNVVDKKNSMHFTAKGLSVNVIELDFEE